MTRSTKIVLAASSMAVLAMSLRGMAPELVRYFRIRRM